MNFSFENLVRQGDVFFYPMDIPVDAIEASTDVVKTGAHTHRMTGGKVFTLGSSMFVTAGVVVHEEHKPATLNGTYQVLTLEQLNGASWGPVED